MMRIGLFLLTNLAVVVIAGIILSVLGVGSYRSAGGLDLSNLLVLCFVFGMVGSIVSLFMSKWMALKTTGTELIDRNVFGRADDAPPGLAFIAITIVLDIVFGILASSIVMWFSRQREYRADEAGAQLAGKEAMISALLRLQAESDMPDQMPKEMKAFAITEGKEQGFSLAALFQTHPSIEQRVTALRQLNVIKSFLEILQSVINTPNIMSLKMMRVWLK